MKINKFVLKVFIFIFFSIGCVQHNYSFSQSVNTLKKKKEKNAKEIEYTNQLLSKTLKNKKASMGQLNVLIERIEARQGLIKSIEYEIDFLNDKIGVTNVAAKRKERELFLLKKQYEKVILYAHRQKSSYEKLMFLLASKDFNQAYKRYKYLQQFSEHSRKKGAQISSKKHALAKQLNILNSKRAKKKELLLEKESEKRYLSLEKNQKSQLISQLQKQEKQLRSDLKKQKRYAKKLEREIQKVIEQQARLAAKKKKLAKGKNKSTPAERNISLSFVQSKGKLPWPTKTGFISERFGEHNHPVLKYVKVRNDGINITTDAKAECRSIFKGEITHILSMPGLNNVVIVRHGEYFTVYSNLASVVVKKGQKITAKQKIGTVFTNVSENQTILKFQLWKGSKKLNPAQWLNRN